MCSSYTCSSESKGKHTGLPVQNKRKYSISKKIVSLQRIIKVSKMTTVIIEDNGVQAKSFVEYARTLPFATIVTEKKKGFEEAVSECNGITVDAFFDELDERIKKRFHA